MAVVTASVIGIGVSAYQVGDNIVKANKAQKKIDNFKPQELNNPNKDIQLSTLKAEQQTKANNINVATSVDTLQRTGTRGVLAGIPRLNEGSILLQSKISQDLERQDRERDILIARGEERIQGIQERREREALQGLGQELNVANQNIATGISDFASSGLALGQSLKGTESKTGFDDALGTDFTTKTKPFEYTFGQSSGLNLNKGEINPLTGLPY